MLNISREGISRDFITDYSATERYIKLPIENYLKLLNFNGKNVYDELNRPQIAFINAVNDPRYRFICAALSRRLGKTFIANVIGQLVALMPNCNVLIMSPNYSLSAISFELQRKFIKFFDLEVEKDNLKDKVIELANGSTIRMGSISTVDSCVGRSYDLIIFDEAALSADAEAAFNVSLRPTLDKPGAKAIFISTPRGRNNWFSRFFQRGFSSDKKYAQWISLHADYLENDRMTEEDVAEARATMSVNEFEQEYMASFTIFEGQIYQFNKDCITERESLEGVEFLAGLDPGYKDPTALIILAYDGECFWVVDEYLESGVVTASHAAAITELFGKYGVETLFIDSAAAQFAADLAYTYDIASIKAKKDVLPGIAYVQTLVEQDRIKVAPHCLNTLAMLDQYSWDPKETLVTEKPKHDDFSHMADALRYALYSYTI